MTLFDYPTLSASMQALIRVAYGVLLLLTLVAAAPHASRYFRTERWGGYAASSGWTDAVQNPLVSSGLMALWFTAAACLIFGWWVTAAAAINLAICHYLFIRMRWRGVLRGMGAPGFIAFWLGAVVFALELTARHAPSVRTVALLAAQIDFALIMLSAGVYKLASGYRHGDGMELGMANPEWGYRAAAWQRVSPTHPLFRVFNELAWGTEVFGGIAMLLAPTRQFGGLAILLSFVFIATQIRLGWLCEMVMVCCLIFIPAGGAVDRLLTAAVPAAHVSAGAPLPGWMQAALGACLWTYIGLLPLVRIGMYYNQLAHKPLPRLLQRLQDAYTNLFGLILWRVFSADVTNFFVRVWETPAAGGARRLISDYEGFTGFTRFRQVAECIAITSVFTTLRYYPSNNRLFAERLLRYAQTVPHAEGTMLVFEWVAVTKRPGAFAMTPVAEYRVDVKRGAIDETVLSTAVSVRAAAAHSPVHEGVRPGSYVPLKS